MAHQDKTTLKNNGIQLTHERNQLDFPVLPVQQMEELHRFRPDIVDFIVEETRNEAQHRRRMEKRVFFYPALSNMIGQTFGLFIGLSGIAGGVYAAVNGQPGAGGTIASIAIGTLAVAFLKFRRN